MKVVRTDQLKVGMVARLAETMRVHASVLEAKLDTITPGWADCELGQFYRVTLLFPNDQEVQTLVRKDRQWEVVTLCPVCGTADEYISEHGSEYHCPCCHNC